MNYNDLPEWYLPYFDNFTGPFWSDGKFQGSTSRSKKKPLTKLDWHSRDHDSEYALCDSLSCLDDADLDYFERTRNMSLGPQIIGTMPLIGNKPLREIYKLLGWGYRGSEAHLAKMGAKQSQKDDKWKQANPLKPGYEYVYSGGGQVLGMRPKVAAVPIPLPKTEIGKLPTAKPNEPKMPDAAPAAPDPPVIIEKTGPGAGETTQYEPDLTDKRGSIDISGNGHPYYSGFPHPLRGYVKQKKKKKKKNKIYIAY